MYIKHINMHHDAVDTCSALGLSFDTQIIVNERVMFTHFANSILAIETYGSLKDCPHELKTVSGDLKATLNLIDDEVQYELTLLSFHDVHSNAVNTFNGYMSMKESNDFLGKIIRFSMQEADQEYEKRINQDLEYTNEKKQYLLSTAPSKVIKRIDLVKEANFNFDRYFDLVKRRLLNVRPDTSYIDEILRKAINDE